MPAMRVIRCDCGFEATGDGDGDGDGDGELVSRAQAHARGVHGIEVPADLILGLAEPEASPDKR